MSCVKTAESIATLLGEIYTLVRNQISQREDAFSGGINSEIPPTPSTNVPIGRLLTLSSVTHISPSPPAMRSVAKIL